MEIPAIIQDDVQRFVGAALLYAGWVLDRVDAVRRLTDVVVLVRLGGAGWMPWRTDLSTRQARPPVRWAWAALWRQRWN